MQKEVHTVNIFVIGDLHLSFGTPGKKMDIFGDVWKDHGDKIAGNWKRQIKEDDLVLLPGDISWGKKIEDALPDLEWVDQLPGKKVMIRGNHDYWWQASKLKALPFKSIEYIQNNALNLGDVSIGGTRLWDTQEFNLSEYFPSVPIPYTLKNTVEEDEKIYRRELLRLEESLKLIDPAAPLKIAMVHYPPIGPDQKPTQASQILEKYNIDICVFGHLHGLIKPISYGEIRGVTYYLTSCDYLNCNPIRIH